MRQRLLYAESPKWARVIEAADDLMNSSAFTPVKSEGRTRAGFLKLADGSSVFLKRADARGRIAGIYDRFRGSCAARALRGGAILRAAGFRCPAPLAAMEVLEGRAIARTYLLSEPLERAEILSHFALGPAGVWRGYARRKASSDALASELRRLHDAGIYSKDLQETNIMMERGNGGMVIYFLDLEDFRRARRVSWRRRMMNLVHLDRSIGRFVGRAGRLAFLYSYLGGVSDRRKRSKLVAAYLRMRESVDRAHRRRTSQPAVAPS